MITLKKNLLKMREEILKEIDQNVRSGRNIPERDVGDFYDDVDIEKGRQMIHLLGERERQKLNAIDNALEKIADGEYGFCEECGEEINKKRLKVIPFAKYCIRCQSEMERRSTRLQESMEDKLIYKDVSISDVDTSDE